MFIKGLLCTNHTHRFLWVWLLLNKLHKNHKVCISHSKNDSTPHMPLMIYGLTLTPYGSAFATNNLRICKEIDQLYDV